MFDFNENDDLEDTWQEVSGEAAPLEVPDSTELEEIDELCGQEVTGEAPQLPVLNSSEADTSDETLWEEVSSILKKSGRKGNGWVYVQPSKGLCNRLRAVVAAWMLADDLERELVIDWRPTAACNCPWQRLISPVQGLHLLTPELLKSDVSLRAALDLADSWGLVVAYSKRFGGDTSLHAGVALEHFNQRHKIHFRHGHAYFPDTTIPKWKKLPRLRDIAFENLPDFLQVHCLVFRSFEAFYPCSKADLDAAVVERGKRFRELKPTPAITQHLWDLPPGTVSVHIRRTDHALATRHSPQHIFELEMDKRISRHIELADGVAFSQFFLATDDPDLEAHLQSHYGDQLVSYKKRTLNRASPEGIEDAFIDLLMLAQGTEIIGSFRSSFSGIASIYNNIPIKTVYKRVEGGMESTGPLKPYREVSLFATDPSEPSGPFYLAGSWNQWMAFMPLLKSSGDDKVYSARVKVEKAPGTEEFQIVQDRDWSKRFYPSHDDQTDICGPDNRHGSNFVVEVPFGCKWLEVIWDPRKMRSFNCKPHFVKMEWFDFEQPYNEAEDPSEVSGPFFLAGSWNNWEDFMPLDASRADGFVCSARVRVRKAPGVEEFQVILERDWTRRFYPAPNSKTEILGPSDEHGANFVVQIPAGCTWLEVIWDPRKIQRSFKCRCLGVSGREVTWW